MMFFTSLVIRTLFVRQMVRYSFNFKLKAPNLNDKPLCYILNRRHDYFILLTDLSII